MALDDLVRMKYLTHSKYKTPLPTKGGHDIHGITLNMGGLEGFARLDKFY